MKKRMILPALLVFSVGFAAIETKATAETAEDNYKLYCAQCHGVKGNGAGINKGDMPTTPRNHTNTVEMSKLKDSDLHDVTAQGGPATGKSTLMPPWNGILSEDEIKDMVVYLRKLCNCKGE